jgi:hypothetical protein
MALTTCPECRGDVSTEAAACPHCGYPRPTTGWREPQGERAQSDKPTLERHRDHVAKAGGPRWYVWPVVLGALIATLIIVYAASRFIQTPRNASMPPQAPSVPTGTPPPPQMRAVPSKVFGTFGNGTHTTEKFTILEDWDLSWYYDCSNFAFGQGNFQVMAYSEGDQLPDIAVNQLGRSGRNVEHLHHGGNVYLVINSVCKWQVSAWQTESGAAPPPQPAVVRNMIESIVGAGTVSNVSIDDKANTVDVTVTDVLVRPGQSLAEKRKNLSTEGALAIQFVETRLHFDRMTVRLVRHRQVLATITQIGQSTPLTQYADDLERY